MSRARRYGARCDLNLMIQDQCRTRRTTSNRVIAIVFGAVASLTFPPQPSASELRCSIPVTDRLYYPTATDCLHILRTAVGLAQCEPACVCQPAGGPTTRTADALLCLQRSLLLPVLLDCKCPGSTLEVHDYSEPPVLQYEHMESFGFCAGLDSVLCAKIEETSGDALKFRATLLVEGDRLAGDDCLDVDVFADHSVDCVTVRNLEPRLLTEAETALVKKRLSRVQIDLAPDERCDDDFWWDDTCDQGWFYYSGAFVTDEYCATRRLDWDQVNRTLGMLDILVDNSVPVSLSQSRFHLLDCPCFMCPPTPYPDECVTNQDCIHFGDFSKPYCSDGWHCTQCLVDEHCEDGWWCNRHERQCVISE
jgi:hypothetical protein